MRANRSTLVRLCLLTALAVPFQRAVLTTGAQAAQTNDPQLVAQAEAAAPFTTATSPDGALTARVDENNQVIIEETDGTLAAGPLETEAAVTALAFSEDGQILATGTEAGTVRYWNVDGTPQGEAFPVVLGGDNAITDLEFNGNDRLYAAGSEGRSGFWGLNGLSYGEEAIAQTTDTSSKTDTAGETAADNGVFPWWWLVLLLALGGVGLWLLSRRRSPEPSEPTRQTAPTATVPPPDESNNGEMSTRAQSIISTDRVTDDSRAASPPADEPLPPVPLPIGLPGVEPEAAGIADESTDLESPDLEGTNLDLLAPTADGSGIEVMADTPATGVESEDEDVWDDNLDLTLDEAPEAPEVLAAEMPSEKEPTAEMDDFWGTTGDSGLGEVVTIEPTRDTVIAGTETIPDLEPTRETIISEGAVIFGAVVASVRPEALDPLESAQAVPPSDSTPMKDAVPLSAAALASVDDNLPELPDGYGDSRIVILPRDPKWAYAYWDVSNIHKEALRQQGGERLMLRLYDVTDVDQLSQSAHSMQQQECHEMARSWYIEMPVSDRDYTIEIGYLTADDRWLMLARSAAVRVPPVYPSNWIKDQFRTVDSEEPLAGRTVADLGRPADQEAEGAITGRSPIYETLFAAAQGQAAMRIAGSLYGSMQAVPPGALSMSGGMNVSGLTVSGLNVSGIGSGGGEMPERSRKFWLVADAELIVYGATEPDATLTVGDRVIPLNPDGTFRFHVAFPDGQIDYPIEAVAVDGEQSRSVSLHFERETPERDTNTQEEAEDEWF